MKVKLMDGSIKEFEKAENLYEIAKQISNSLAKKSVAAKVNGELRDMSDIVDFDAEVEFLDAYTPEGLHIIRHSCAHLLGHAVKQLYPDVKMVIGPVIEDGFYYDMYRETPFTLDEMEIIEKRMVDLINQDYDVIKKITPRAEVIKVFTERNEDYKIRLIEDMPEEKSMGLYYHQEYIDMCRGPHVPNTKFLKAFKLTKISGAYWRGDSNNEQLQRVYGTAWADKKELKAYLTRIEEAEKRDHRKLGRQLDLFHLQEESPGMIFWHPKGWALWQVVEQYMRGVFIDNGYKEVKTPIIIDKTLWEKSGHWENYKELMFITESEKRDFAVKPMNCPAHVQIFNSELHSYRDLPLRLAEFGCCHRNEPSGALHGIMRVRGFVQDDAHIFCREDQILSEAYKFDKLVRKVYDKFEFKDVLVKLALRPDKRAGTDETWDKAEEGLREALRQNGVEWEELPGEGAFYGPKVEYHIKDALGRSWQCGTIQLDFVLPERLGAEYITEENEKAHPVMLHRAILGSLERFIGILIENYAGVFPFWLAPTQVKILTINDEVLDYANEVLEKLRALGVRAELDGRVETIGYKIREANGKYKIPVQLVIGKSEVENKEVNIRRFGSKDQETHKLEEFLVSMEKELKSE